MTGEVIWYELMTTDAEAARRFYEPVLGWSVSAADDGAPGSYRMIEAGRGLVGGILTLTPEALGMGIGPCWVFYAHVPDVDEAAAAIVQAGGAIHMPATDVPEAGRFAFVSDPQGALFYVMTPNGTGPASSHQPETPGYGGWHELGAADGDTALDFYRTQFGWEADGVHDMGAMGLYRLFRIGPAQSGGVMTDRSAPRPHWRIYFNVDSASAAADRVAAGGGEVVRGPMQVPSGAWVLDCRDPQGARLNLVAPAP